MIGATRKRLCVFKKAKDQVTPVLRLKETRLREFQVEFSRRD